jgi:transcriptional regulator of heat shock response
MDLNDRQKTILMAIIAEFMKTADEVGSSYLVEKYGFKFSPATVRSEMVQLMEKGLLEQSHSSAGRVPTDQAIRMYVQEKFGQEIMEAVDFIQIRQGLFKVRFDPEKLIKSALNSLVDYASCASFILMGDMTRYYGVSSLMKYHELRNIEIVERVLDILEDENLMKKVFSKYDVDNVSFIIGSESGIKDMENCAIVFTKVPFWGEEYGHMGLIGSRRMDYGKAVNVLTTVRDSLQESLRGWK